MAEPRFQRHRIALHAVALAVVSAGLILGYHIAVGRDPGFFPVAKPPYRLADYAFRLERTGCFGNCPDFILTVEADGTTIVDTAGDFPFDGREREIRLQNIRYSWKIGPARHERLVALLEEGRFWELRSDYSRQVTDSASTRIGVDTPNRDWSVDVYAVPCQSDGWRPPPDESPLELVPDVFCELAEQLDSVACDTYTQGKKSSPDDALVPFRPPHCEASR